MKFSEKFIVSIDIFVQYILIEKKVDKYLRDFDLSFALILSNSQPFIDLYIDIFNNFHESTKKNLTGRNIFLILLRKYQIIDIFLSDINLEIEDNNFHQFIEDNKTELTDTSKLKLLNFYKDDLSRLNLFFEYFGLACSTKYPFQQIELIHKSFQILVVYLNCKILEISEQMIFYLLPFLQHAP